MQRIIKFSCIIFITALLTLFIGAKEIVVYENDFSKSDLLGCKENGNWQIADGVLKTESGSGSAYLTYNIPEEYKGCNYRIDVDFLGHTSTGGIMIGAEIGAATAIPKIFHGFDCFTSSTGTKAVLGCYNDLGNWSGNICNTDEYLPLGDLHLTVFVRGNEFVYRVYSLDKKTQYCGISYTLGTSELESYTAFSNVVGLRKFYSDKGCFDNLKITVYTDDVLPTMDSTVDFGTLPFNASGITKDGSAFSGNGAMLSTTAIKENFKATLTLTPNNVSKILFGMTDEKNGYAFSVDKNEETVALYQIKDGKYILLGERNTPVGDKSYTTSVSVHNKIVSVLFDAYQSGGTAFPDFEMEIPDYTAGKLGIWLEGGKVEALSVTDSTGKEGETYLNPVFVGADPEVRYFDGTYFAYRRVSEGKNVVRVYTSPDLVHWTERNIVFTHKDNYTTNSYMSPNVICYDGIYYLFMACKNAEGKHRITYSSSSSPYGPFEFIGDAPTFLHDDVSEIGGIPYIDDDGKAYLAFARFGNGNHSYIEEFTLKDGKVTPVDGTLSHIVSPQFEYEIDGHGNISEGGIIYKHNGYYYATYASGHYLGHYGQSYLVSENVLGPYKLYEYNEIITHNSAVDGVGDGMFVESPDGTEIWFVYHQHAAIGTVEPRQTRIDKVQFIKNPDGGPDIMTINAPSTTPQTVPSFNGRFDLNNDGYTSLADLFVLLQRQAKKPEYKGTFDLDGNGREDFNDSVTLIRKIAH